MAVTMRRQRGFSLVEAMVSLIVLGLGLMAVAALQITLSRSGDLAKQRTEATRLAQEKLEALRTFRSTGVYAGQIVNSNSSTQETVTTNATYTRTWSVAQLNSVDTGRSIQVSVAWTDRVGDMHRVQLVSAVAEVDPLEVGALMFPLPDGTILRRPMDRSLEIPIRATGISGTQKSYIPWSGSSGGYLVFSNVSGDVVQRCSAVPTADSLNSSTACSTLDAYLLSGYLSGSRANSSYITFANPVSFSSAQYMAATPECVIGTAADQTSGATISGYLYYVCLIQPTDHDSNAATARVWSGRSDINVTSGTRVCRYTTSATTTDNDSHPATYSLVTRSLDNQNFSVTSGSCPTGTVNHN